MSIKKQYHVALPLRSCLSRHRADWTVLLKGLMLALLTMLAAGQAQAVNEDGSIDGLKAKFVDVNGIKTRYYEMGRGEPMVLIHAEEGFSGHAGAQATSRKTFPAWPSTFTYSRWIGWAPA